MDRREFMKMIGVGGLLVGLGAIAGAGCPRRTPEEPPMIDPGPPADVDGPVEGEPVDNEVQMLAVCPNCGAENEVPEWGAELTCWRCGFVWTPERPG